MTIWDTSNWKIISGSYHLRGPRNILPLNNPNLIAFVNYYDISIINIQSLLTEIIGYQY